MSQPVKWGKKHIKPVVLTCGASSFKRNFVDPIVIKSLDTILLKEGGDCYFTYTTRCSLDELNDTNVAVAPLMCQSYVENKIDCRVTIIGEQLSAIKILKDNEPIDDDWRQTPKNELSYIDFELPERTKEACMLLVNKLKLSYGAIDLLESNGDFVFLEINPTGEWGWLDNDQRSYGMTIARWLADEK